MHSQYYQGIWYTCKCSCGSGGGRHSIFFQWHNQFYNQYMIMTQCYDKNEFRNYKIPKMCLGQDPDPCSVYMYMQHKVWISMNYILILGFFSLINRGGERALVCHVMYSVLDLGGIISRSPLWFCGKRTRNIPWRISRFRFPTKTKSKSVLYVLKNTMRLVTFGSNLPVYYG